jgi:hypothetical protein
MRWRTLTSLILLPAVLVLGTGLALCAHIAVHQPALAAHAVAHDHHGHDHGGGDQPSPDAPGSPGTPGAPGSDCCTICHLIAGYLSDVPPAPPEVPAPMPGFAIKHGSDQALALLNGAQDSCPRAPPAG